MSIQQNPGMVLSRAKTRRSFLARMGALVKALLTGNEDNPAAQQQAQAIQREHHFHGSSAGTPGAKGNRRKHNGIKWRHREGRFR